MIRFACKHCAAVLRVTPDKAGKVAVCPKCRGRVTIPTPDDIVEASDFEVVEEEPAARPQERFTPAVPRQRLVTAIPRVQPADAPDDDDEEEEAPARPRRRRRRRRRRSSESSGAFFERFMEPFTIGIVCALGLWAFSMLLMFVGVPLAVLAALAVAGITAAVGRIWFLSIAFSEDSTVGMLVLWCPFYDLYYLVSNLEETWRAFATNVLGGVLLMLSLCAGALESLDDT